MQIRHQTIILKTIQLCLLLLLLNSCTKGQRSFDEAIAQQKDSSLSFVPQNGESLPFFTPQTLTPTWEESSKRQIVRIPEFHLLTQSGASIDQSLFKNHISIVGFIFTSCTGFCPLLVKKMKDIEESFKGGTAPQFIVFSVDPEVDTPAKLNSFAKTHKLTSKNWTLITGDKQSIYSLAKETFASEIRKIDSSNMRDFAHTEHFYLIDGKLRLRGILNGSRIDLPEHAAALVTELKNTLKQ
ncbi:hypothetical protein D3C87_189300 [compost metagenome]